MWSVIASDNWAVSQFEIYFFFLYVNLFYIGHQTNSQKLTFLEDKCLPVIYLTKFLNLLQLGLKNENSVTEIQLKYFEKKLTLNISLVL